MISVIIPFKNEEKNIDKCLSSLASQTTNIDNFEIIAINNGSTDGSIEIVKKYPKVKILDGKGLLVGAVRNLGARIAAGEILAFIDADCSAEPDWIENIRELTSSGNLIVGGGIKLPTNPKIIEKYWLLEGDEGHVLPKELIGACTVISKDIFNNTGGFDESISSGEDTLLSTTLRSCGFKIYMSRNISVTHHGNAKNPIDFIKRQIWHSENYLDKPKNIAFDPVFYLVLIYSLSLYVYTFNFIFDKDLTSPALFFFASPAILSFKRIIRTKNIPKNIKRIHFIYLIDHIYMIGRSIGLQKSMIKRFFKK